MNKIKLLRLQSGLSQKKLAEDLNVAQTTVSAWEKNKSNPDIEMYKTIAKYFNIPVQYLITNIPLENALEQDRITAELFNKLINGETSQTKKESPEQKSELNEILAELKIILDTLSVKEVKILVNLAKALNAERD